MIEPAVAADRYLLICGDSRKVLGDLSGVSAIITDTPYGIGYLHSGRGRPPKGRKAGTRHSTAILGDTQPFDPTLWLGRRHRKGDTIPCLFLGANHFHPRLPDGGSCLSWDKTEGGLGPKDSFVDGEFLWCSMPGIKRNVFHHLWKGVVCRKKGEENGRRDHPAQKPIALMRWCIHLMGLPPDSLILDPYMGVGSTIIAALSEGHRAIGIEIDRGYCEVARRRIDACPRPPLGAVATGDRFSRPIASTWGRGGVVPPGR